MRSIVPPRGERPRAILAAQGVRGNRASAARSGRDAFFLTVARRSRIALRDCPGAGRPTAGRPGQESIVAPQFIFTMQDVRKVHPPSKEVLKGLWLSFYPGAKIGVLGVNGSGKSTLLRIMAGVDKEFSGEAKPADGVRVGYLAQEPRLEPGKTVQ